MKLLFVLESFFPTHRAGTEIYVLNLCRYFLGKGYKVDVLISTTTETGDYEYEGIPVYTFKVPPKPIAKELNGIIAPCGIGHFIERVKALKPDLVHFHSFGRAINGYHLQAVKALGIKTAFTPHLATFFCPKGDLRFKNKANCKTKTTELDCNICLLHSKSNLIGKSPFLLGWLIFLITKLPLSKVNRFAALYQSIHRKNEINKVKKNADLVFALLPWMEKLMIEYGITQNILVNQSLPDDFKTIPIYKHEEVSSNLHFAFIGRIHPVKGLHVLLNALKNLNTEIKLSIFTNSNLLDDKYYIQTKHEAICKTNVIWHENLSRAELINKLNEIDIVVIPSCVTETGPLTLLEAWAMYKPVIASDNLGILDQVEDGVNGLIFKTNDHNDLSQKMNSVINNPDLLLSLKSNIKQPQTFEFASKKISEEYLKLF